MVFSWAPDCITATRLKYGDQEAVTLKPQASPLLCVGPAHSNTIVDLHGAQHCSISVTQGGSPSSAKFDAAVEAATAVAVGTIPIPGRRVSQAVAGLMKCPPELLDGPSTLFCWLCWAVQPLSSLWHVCRSPLEAALLEAARRAASSMR